MLERRSFFRSLAREVMAALEELCGRPQCPLTDLWRMTDADLARIMPRVLDGVEIIVEGHQVSARRQGDDSPIVLFEDRPSNTVAFNGFNGATTIEEVAGQVAGAMGWDGQQSFQHSKELFLQLVRLRVCVPANTIEYKLPPPEGAELP